MTQRKVLYIAGYGRSGSTILDMLLGSSSSFMGAGELTNVFDLYYSNASCSCGLSYPDCPFWATVMGELHSRIPQFDAQHMSRITTIVESGLVMMRVPSDRRTILKHYGWIWKNMFHSISKISSASVIVDSSKNSRLTVNRPLALMTRCGLEICAIHLVRDPRAILWSLLEGSNRNLENGLSKGNKARKVGAVYRGMFNWCLSNLSVHFFQIWRNIPVIRLRYEDLILNPVAELERIEKAFGMDLTRSKEIVQKNQSIPAGHGVAGNRLRRAGPQPLQLNEDWKNHLPTYARLLAISSLPLASAYGYRVGHLFPSHVSAL